MARIFISHSSRDNEAADRMKVWLSSHGFENVFLDKDSATGIPPGADWEKTLYLKLDQSQAVIILETSNWQSSKWCFAEYTQARALGKAIFPIVETSITGSPISPGIQKLNLTGDRKAGLEQLARELKRIALGPGGLYWDGSRPPYPGLLAFQEQDAAVYFGRDDEIRLLIERLDAQRARGGTKLIALLGSSGSGKSSLLRAGVIPRLKRMGNDWIIAPPLRPGERPVDSLAVALARVKGAETDWRDLLGDLLGSDPSGTLYDFANDLRVKAAGAASILIAIDQAEELFGVSRSSDADRFLEILSVMLSESLPFIAVMALRSEYLGQLQSAKMLTARFEDFSLRPMTLTRIPEIIRGPARIAGVQVEDAFVGQAVRDAQTEDALPLLAFMLRELLNWPLNKPLSLERYTRLGDDKEGLTPIENAVRQAADRVLIDARPTENELSALREAFVPKMVGVNDDGEYVGRPARLDSLPQESLRLLKLLENARLISRPQNEPQSIEVAHEALLRKWPKLKSWLDAQRGFLLGKRQLEQDLREFQQAPEADKASVWLTGPKLTRARVWLDEHPKQLTAEESAFILGSIKRAEDEEANKTLRRRLVTSLSIAAAAVLAVFTGWALWSNHNAQLATKQAVDAKQNERVAREKADENARNAEAAQKTAIENEASARLNESRAFAALARSAVDEEKPRAALTFALAALPTSDKNFIPTNSDTLAFISKALGTLHPTSCQRKGSGALFLSDNSLILWHDDIVELRDKTECAKITFSMKNNGAVNGVLLYNDNTHILVWADKAVYQWDLTTGRPIGAAWTHNSEVEGVKLLPDGKRAISWTYATIKLWDIGSNSQIGSDIGSYVGAYQRLRDVVVLDNDHIVAVFDANGPMGEIWSLRKAERKSIDYVGLKGATPISESSQPFLFTNEEIVPWEPKLGQLKTGEIKRNDVAGLIVAKRLGKLLSWAHLDEDGRGAGIETWDLKTGKSTNQRFDSGHEEEGAVLSGRENRLFVWSKRKIRQWDTATGKQVGKELYFDEEISGISCSETGQRFAVWTESGDVFVYDELGDDVIHVVRRIDYVKPYLIIFSDNDQSVGLIDNRFVLFDRNGNQIGKVVNCAERCDAVAGRFFVNRGNRILVLEPESKVVAVLDFSQGTLVLIDLNDKVLTSELSSETIGNIIGFASGTRIAFTYDRKIWIRNLDTGLTKLLITRGPADGFQIEDNESELVVNEGGQIELIDLKTEASLGVPFKLNNTDVPHSEGYIVDFHIVDDGKAVISWTNREIDYWMLATGKLIKNFTLSEELDTMQVSLAGLGHRLLVWGADSESNRTSLRQVDIAAGEQIGGEMDMGHVIIGAFLFDNESKILSWSRGAMSIWDAETGRQLGPTMESYGIESIYITRDGKRILTWHNGDIQIWDIPTRQPIGTSLRYEDDPHSESIAKLEDGFEHPGEIDLRGLIDEQEIRLASGEVGRTTIRSPWGKGSLFEIACAALGGAPPQREFEKYQLSKSSDICGPDFRPSAPKW